MKKKLRLSDRLWLISVVVALAGVLTAAILADVKAGTLLVLVLAGLAYALIWEGGTRVGGAVQRRLQRQREAGTMRQLLTLMMFTILAFGIVEGIELATGEGWSWIWAAGFAVALLFQLVALIVELRSPGND